MVPGKAPLTILALAPGRGAHAAKAQGTRGVQPSSAVELIVINPNNNPNSNPDTIHNPKTHSHPGAGAWACAAAKLVAGNLAREELEDQFSPALRVWVREEELPDGRKLTDVFNETRENPKCAEAASHSAVDVRSLV